MLKLLLTFFMCLPMWASSLRAQDQPYAEYDGDSETLTFRYGAKPAGAYDLNEGNATPRWWDDRFISEAPEEHNKIRKVVFDASFANARPTSCYMWFDRCYDLTEIEGIANLNTEEVTNMRSMFSACRSLTSLDVSHFNTQKVEDMSDMFSGCSGLKSLNVSHFDTQNVKDMNSMFYNCSSLTSLDVSNFNTQNVTNMGYMFSWCEGLNSLDLSKFDTQNVKYMNDMFWSSSALKTIYVSDKFVTTKVSSGGDMFKDCTSLKGAIDFDASKTDHTYANYNTGYFTLKHSTAYVVFNEVDGTLTFGYGAKPAGAYDLNEGSNNPAWYDQRTNIKKVVFDASFANARPTSCKMWFYSCNNLTEIEGIANLNTEEVTSMDGMFTRCSKLTSLDLSNFNTQKVTNMFGMFTRCSKLTSLDLSKFDTQKVTDMTYMFSGCSALTTIYVSDKFVTTKVSDGTDMFYGCTSLKGAIKYEDSSYGYPEYSEGNNDHTYANYKTGYFTKLVGKNGNDKIGAVGEVLTAESLALADDKDFEAYEPFTAKTATYTRILKEGTSWATLCLPFNVELEGQDFRAFNLLSATDDIIKLQEVETSIEAGKPVVIKMNEGENTLSFTYSGTTIAPEAQTVQALENSGYKLTGIYTQKVFDKTADNNCFIIKGGSLMNPAMILSKTSTQTVGTKPFRAYMQEDGTEGGARAFSLSFEGEATAISTLNGVDADNAEYYDLQGRRINSLQKGINIIKHGGKATKILIR